MRCTECGHKGLIRDTRDIEYVYKGKPTKIPKVHGEFCPECGEGVFEPEEGQRVSEFMLNHNRDVNSDLYDTQLLKKVRLKLKVNRKEAGRLFGGGVNGFARYESGDVKPPVALMQLIGILDNHPDLIKEVRVQAEQRMHA